MRAFLHARGVADAEGRTLTLPACVDGLVFDRLVGGGGAMPRDEIAGLVAAALRDPGGEAGAAAGRPVPRHSGAGSAACSGSERGSTGTVAAAPSRTDCTTASCSRRLSSSEQHGTGLPDMVNQSIAPVYCTVTWAVSSAQVV